jgi:hypothetical protein
MLQACNFTFDQVGDHQSSISPTTSVDVPPFIDCPLRTIFTRRTRDRAQLAPRASAHPQRSRVLGRQNADRTTANPSQHGPRRCASTPKSHVQTMRPMARVLEPRTAVVHGDARCAHQPSQPPRGPHGEGSGQTRWRASTP